MSFCQECQKGCTVCNGCLNNGPGTNYDNEDCSFLNWYFNYGPSAIQLQEQTVQPTSVTKCINPVYSILNYTVSISAGLNNNGTISYYQTTITNSFTGNRVWNFTIAGTLTTPALTITYQFDPNCFVPNSVDNLLLSQINFNNTTTGDANPLTGFLVINNFNLSLSGIPLGNPGAPNNASFGSFYPISYSWNPATATFLLNINIRGPVVYNGMPNTPAQPVGTCTFAAGKVNSFYAALTILDGTNLGLGSSVEPKSQP